MSKTSNAAGGSSSGSKHTKANATAELEATAPTMEPVPSQEAALALLRMLSQANSSKRDAGIADAALENLIVHRDNSG